MWITNTPYQRHLPGDTERISTKRAISDFGNPVKCSPSPTVWATMLLLSHTVILTASPVLANGIAVDESLTRPRTDVAGVDGVELDMSNDNWKNKMDIIPGKIRSENFIAKPVLQALWKSRPIICEKSYRKSYCMNGGSCEWIPEIDRPRCTCVFGWKGTRCHESNFDFVSASERRRRIFTALIVSLFGVLGVSLVGCICWRRVKYIRKRKESKMETTTRIYKTEENEKNTEVIYVST